MLSHELRTPGTFKPMKRYHAINPDGTSAAILPDVVAVATYLMIYSKDCRVTVEHGEGQEIWYGTKERQAEKYTADSLITLLKGRLQALLKAGCFDPERQRWKPDGVTANFERFGAPNNPPKVWRTD